jgi:CheY-like chemotaxis protein
VENALELIDATSFDVIISDYPMPGTDGIGFLKILREKCCANPFILFAGRGREEVMTVAQESGALFYLQKGGNPRSRFTERDNKMRETCGRYLAEDPVQEKRCTAPPLSENARSVLIFGGRGLKNQACGCGYSLAYGSQKRKPGEARAVQVISIPDMSWKADTVTAPRYAYISNSFSGFVT